MLTAGRLDEPEVHVHTTGNLREDVCRIPVATFVGLVDRVTLARAEGR
jgi:hypothetical protein